MNNVIKKIFPIILIIALAFVLTHSSKVDAQTADEPFEVCMGKSLAKYMNTVLDATHGKLHKIKFTSPAFNMTNPAESQIFSVMKQSGAEFQFLDAFAGNTYTNVPGDGSGRSGYQWFVDNGWKSGFGGKPTIFTEFGDFLTKENAPGEHSAERISKMRLDFNQAASDGSIISINYFNALDGGNEDPGFLFHRLSVGEYQQITAGNGKSGLNSANWAQSGAFHTGVVAPAGAKWAVEIMGGPDSNVAAASVNAGLSVGVNTVLRLCVGDSCPFADPEKLISFLNELESKVNGPVWVLIGPNEPATEHWAGPLCKPSQVPFVLSEVPCTATIDPEFHSLRPYPTSPCNKEVDKSESVWQCGQDLVVKERFEFKPSDGICETVVQDGGTILRCNYTKTSDSDISLGLNKAEFPILGNTELVTNSENRGSPSPSLSFLQRLNEYVSWYLNGIPYRAEEKYFKADEIAEGTIHSNPIIDFAGPLKKLLPQKIQRNLREEQQQNSKGGDPSRHNQIVDCGDTNNPQECYKSSDAYNRLQSINDPRSPSFSYIPFSSTEDRIGEANSSLNIAEGTCSTYVNDPTKLGLQCADFKPENEKRNLYFAHIEETKDLSKITQGLFKTKDVDDTDSADDSQRTELNATPFCELIESRTNPGDRLYGELSRDGQTKQISGSLSYSANFQCDFALPTPESVLTCQTACGDDLACAANCSNPTQTCQREIYIPFSVKVYTPDIKTIWERLVSGSQSVFKRFFPLVSKNAPVDELKDIPGETNASYISQNTGSTGGGTMIESKALAGNPAAQRDGSSAKIYFAHLGSIYDYFLKDVQKALRPKSIAVPDSDSEAPMCSIDNSGIGSATLRNIIAAAAAWAKVPVQALITTVRIEGGCKVSPNSGICALSDSEVAMYSEPGAKYPYNCNGVAKGPLQFFDAEWNIWKQAVNKATGEGRSPEVCNIKDSVYAAAYELSATMANNVHCAPPNYDVAKTPPASSWTQTDIKYALTRWAGGCTIGLCGSPNGLSGSNAEAFAATYCNFYDSYANDIRSNCNQ